MARKVKGKAKKKNARKNRPVNFEKTEEKYNNNIILMGLKPWEKKYLRLLPWSYVEEGIYPKVHGHLELLEPLKCEETLVRMDQHDVKAVLKIMGHNWPAGQKKPKNKKDAKNWGTKDLDELVVSVCREEDELVSWWKRPYCMETVKKHLKPSSATPRQPLFFETFDQEERLWGFAQRIESSMLKAKPKNPSIRKTRNAGKPGSRMAKSVRTQKTKKTKGKPGQ